MNKKQTIVSLIEQGLTAKEIQTRLGLNHPARIYQYAKESGLKVTSENDRRLEAVIKMATDGKHYDEIAQALGTDRKTITNYCWVHGIRVTPKPVVKGIYKDEDAIAALAKHNPDWEYIGDYTGSDGYMTIRHICGYVTRKSSVTIRHNAVRCEHCLKKEREEKKKAMERSRKAEAFRKRKVPKYVPIEMRECCICGALFLTSHKNRVCCSKECSVKAAHRYSIDKREEKRRMARTKDSYQINALSLYRRDRGVCWICGGQCDLEADPNSDWYPSVDHIVVVSQGGKDEWSNVRLAHRRCNSRRGTIPAHLIVPRGTHTP